ncbi:MAG: peptide-methionine (S)-S-oxide reductase MsrA [Actinomycetaceae bacterium]|nr:peptide-methionine (S)-S-oxide reductase MsrA [Actinomycetaceae bacterium]
MKLFDPRHVGSWHESTPQMVSPEQALPGRDTSVLAGQRVHAVLGGDMMRAPVGDEQVLYVAGGCYWGVEEIMWQLPGVRETAVGFMGGFTPNPTYEEVCTGLTGHTETVRVLFDPHEIAVDSVLKTFWESHDPTTINRQGNDIGTQYRSAIFFTNPQHGIIATQMRAAYADVLTAHGKGDIVTEIMAAAQAGAFYPAEEYHQQYLHKNPHGYRCHAATGMSCPIPGASPLANLRISEPRIK